MAERVNIDDFAQAETSRMFAAIAAQAGGTGTWFHNRTPTPLDNQPVIRQNRDTLYSACLLDASEGATLTIPEAGDRPRVRSRPFRPAAGDGARRPAPRPPLA
jgi:hypothetical protein